MPEYSTVRDFVAALQSGMTNTTKVLQHLWDNRNDPAVFPPNVLANLGTYSLHPLAPDLEQLFRNAGMKPGEILHLNHWPDAEKQKMRGALLGAGNQTVRFFWELHRGDDEETEVTPAPGGGVDIYFRSPRKRLALSAGPTFGGMKAPVPPHP